MMTIDTDELQSVRRRLHLEVRARRKLGETSAEQAVVEDEAVERLIDREMKRQYRARIPDERVNH